MTLNVNASMVRKTVYFFGIRVSFVFSFGFSSKADDSLDGSFSIGAPFSMSQMISTNRAAF